MKNIQTFENFINESLKDDVVDMYFNLYDKDENIIDQEKLDSMIPDNLLADHTLNYDQMFRKMKDEDLRKILSYFKSLE